ncbi:hypothetical protein LAZ67_5004514 [Cordylochernes scorpioides]|uniref:Uncharacterized protein n=1 Tax=Cordylochernes scorpioides TaxID=51811 RepID=A0ABY6KI57_9ARAC|nr:hypothetical protein LAZ67_5004514 [Cordylochernes scorpioides]
MLEVLRTDRRLSIQQIADTLHMSTFVVHGIVTEDLQMRKVCAKLVPKVLTQDQKELRVLRCKELLDLIQNEPDFLNSVVTGDEFWMFEYDPESKRQNCAWHTKSSPRPKKARMSKSRIKTMIIVFFDIRGIVHYTVKLHHDNATSHTAFIITNFLARSNTSVIPLSPSLQSRLSSISSLMRSTVTKKERLQEKALASIGKDPSKAPFVMHTRFPAPVIFFGVISTEGDVMSPHFFEQGFRVNADTYINVLEACSSDAQLPPMLLSAFKYCKGITGTPDGMVAKEERRRAGNAIETELLGFHNKLLEKAHDVAAELYLSCALIWELVFPVPNPNPSLDPVAWLLSRIAAKAMLAKVGQQRKIATSGQQRSTKGNNRTGGQSNCQNGCRNTGIHVIYHPTCDRHTSVQNDHQQEPERTESKSSPTVTMPTPHTRAPTSPTTVVSGAINLELR